MPCIVLVLQILGLDDCSDVVVGDMMRRGISGGQKKRVTTGASSHKTKTSTGLKLLNYLPQMGLMSKRFNEVKAQVQINRLQRNDRNARRYLCLSSIVMKIPLLMKMMTTLCR